MKMIGSQMTAQFWMSSQTARRRRRRPARSVGDAEGVAAVLARERQSGQVDLPVVRQRPARRVEDLAEVLARLVAGEVAGLLDRHAVAALDERERGDALFRGELDRPLAFGGAALGEGVRSGAEQHRERTQEGRSLHLVTQSEGAAN